MTWVFDDKLPIYLQIIQILKADIARGKYQTGEKLPAVRELALTAGVNPNTMQKALSELERSGLVYSQRTSGRFITEDAALIQNLKRELAHMQIQEFLHKMKGFGFDFQEIIDLIKALMEEEKNE